MKNKIIIICIFFFFCKINLNAQEIDSSFNSGNFIFPSISVSTSQNEKSRQVLIQDDNKIIIISHVGLFTDASYNSLQGSIIERYNPDGSLDSSYGNNGRVQIPHVSITGKIVSDGKLIIGSLVYRPLNNFNYYIGFVKIDNNGNYDNSFGTNGILATETFVFDGFGNNFTEFEFSNSGNIYLLWWVFSGSTPFGPIYQTNLYKFNSNYQLDFTFQYPANSSQNSPAYDVLEDNQQNIYISLGSNSKLLRLTSSGVIDTNFGDSGIMNLSNGGIQKFIQLPNSKILCSTNMNSMVRYNPDFTLDNSFGNNGILNDNNKSFELFQFDSNNNIIAIGKLNNTVRMLSRYTENGVLDTGNSDDGVANISFNSLGYSINTINDFKIQSDNKIILYGYHDLNNNGTNGFKYQRFLTRLTSNLILDNNDFKENLLDIIIYPNPFQNYFSIDVNSNDYLTADLYDINGRFLQNIFENKLFSESKSTEEIKLANNLTSGIYFIKLKNNLGLSKTIKICKN